jgi:hypothetical protein
MTQQAHQCNSSEWRSHLLNAYTTPEPEAMYTLPCASVAGLLSSEYPIPWYHCWAPVRWERAYRSPLSHLPCSGCTKGSGAESNQDTSYEEGGLQRKEKREMTGRIRGYLRPPPHTPPPPPHTHTRTHPNPPPPLHTPAHPSHVSTIQS